MTLGAPSYSFSVPEYGRCVVNTAPNDLSLLRQGTIKVVPDNMAGSVRVGSICFSRQLGLGKKFDFRGALTLQYCGMGVFGPVGFLGPRLFDQKPRNEYPS